TAVRGGITGKVPCVHGDATPGEPLHVRHLRAFVDVRFMIDFLLQYGEDAGRGAVPLCAGTHGRAPDSDSVTIHIHRLIGQAHEHDDRSSGRNFGMPGVVARLELLRERRDLATFRVAAHGKSGWTNEHGREGYRNGY